MIIVVTHQLRQIAKALEEGNPQEAIRLVHELREEIDESGLTVTVSGVGESVQENQAKTIGELKMYLANAKQTIAQLQSHLDKAGITDASKLGELLERYDGLCDYAELHGLNTVSLARYRNLHAALTKKG